MDSLNADSAMLTFGVLLFASHVTLSRVNLYDVARNVNEMLLATVARSMSTTLSEEEQYVASELSEFRLGNFQLFNSIAVQISFPVILVVLRDTFKTMSLAMMFSTAFCLLGYCALLAAARHGWQIRSHQVTATGIGLYSMVLGCNLTTAFIDKEDYVLKHSLCFLGQVLSAGLCCNTSINIPFALAYSIASVLSFVNVHGWEKVEALFILIQVMEHGACIGVPAVLERIISTRARSSYRSQEATSLTNGFRRMVKGICDGDLMLDCNLRMCRGTACLQRLLCSEENYTGRPFGDLLYEKKQKAAFEEFLRSDENDDAGVPCCMRVKLMGPQGPKAVDVFHVLLPRPVGPPFHLLAITEDSDVNKVMPDAMPAAVPLSLLRQRRGQALSASVRSQLSAKTRSDFSDASDVIDPYEELREVTLLLSTATSMYDINEVNVRFSRTAKDDCLPLAMPTLKGFMPPVSWARLEEQLSRYVQLLQSGGNPGVFELEPIRLRLPGEYRRFVLARRASVTCAPVDHGASTEVRMYLHLTDFLTTSHRCPHLLEGPNEEDEDASSQGESSVVSGSLDEQSEPDEQMATSSVSSFPGDSSGTSQGNEQESEKLLMQMKKAAKVLNVMK